jgi:hypothetical protein
LFARIQCVLIVAFIGALFKQLYFGETCVYF